MTTITHPETDIVADDTVPAIRMTREFNAPASSVFRAHTDPELFAADGSDRRHSPPRSLRGTDAPAGSTATPRPLGRRPAGATLLCAVNEAALWSRRGKGALDV